MGHHFWYLIFCSGHSRLYGPCLFFRIIKFPYRNTEPKSHGEVGGEKNSVFLDDASDYSVPLRQVNLPFIDYATCEGMYPREIDEV